MTRFSNDIFETQALELLSFLLLKFLPVCQDVRNTRRVGKPVHIFKVLLGDLERTSRDVRNVLANKLARIDCSPVDLFQQE